ncbi:MAG: GDP-mannose 4,6-dehydratase [Candidatus Adlerbacteria bacterium]|nr:GDP-mannose 4,6-dehydratase [Candidatus Adlerbacteria bacterium]
MQLQGKKVVVTGADGFIGSHMVEAALDAGATVRALVCYNSFGSWGWLDSFPKEKLTKIEIVLGDIRDKVQMETLIQGSDIVFHLAALIAIPYSYGAFESFVETNVIGSLNVLEAARKHGSKVLLTSTSEVYGTAQYVPMDEKHPLQGQSPYSSTKIAADHIGEAFYRSFGVPVVIVRPFNTFGPRQSTRAVIPTIATQILSGKEEIQLGRLDPVRDFNFVKDTTSAFIALSQCDAAIGQAVNACSGVGISIGEVAQMIAKVIGKEVHITEDPNRIRPASSEVERLIGSAEKMKSLTGWTPSYTFEQGLAETIQWYTNPENLKHFKAGIYGI